MPALPFLRLRALLCALAAWLAMACWVPDAQAAFGFNDDGWEGTSAFRKLARSKLGKDRVALVATLDWEELTPADGIVIVHPDVTVDYSEASAFLRAGGRIALLDDFGRGNELLKRFQIERIAAPSRPALTLRGNANLAIAVPAIQVVAGHEQGRHPVVANVQQLVTNHPSALRHPNLTPVLKLTARGEPDATLAVTGIIADKGRLFAMADPSAIINLMLRYPGNRNFAGGLAEYLVEDDEWGTRSGKLYLVANRFKQRGHYGGDGEFSDDIEDYVDGFKDLIEDTHRDGLPDWAAMVLAAAVAIGAAAFMITVSTKSYRGTVPRFARATPLIAQGGAAGRAAVLTAPTTHRALALMELKAALDEALSHRLGFASRPGRDELLRQLERQDVLQPDQRAEVAKLLSELERTESAVAAQQPVRIARSYLQQMHRRVTSIMTELEKRSDESA